MVYALQEIDFTTKLFKILKILVRGSQAEKGDKHKQTMDMYLVDVVGYTVASKMGPV